MAKGDSKSNPIVIDTWTVTTGSAPPTGLKVTRAGSEFTLSWAKGSLHGSNSKYDVIKFKWREKINGAWKSWSAVETLSDTATSKKFTVSLTANKKLESVEALISVKEPTISKTKTWKEKKKWYRQTTNDKFTAVTASAVFNVSLPVAPAFGDKTPATNATSFAYEVGGTGDGEATIFSNVKYNVGHSEEWGTKSPASFTGWGSEQSASGASGSISEPTGSSSAVGSTSITSMVRMKSVGPRGETGYTYDQFVYARPLTANNVRVRSTTNRSTGMDIVVAWDKNATSLHPCSEHKVEYFIGNPANGNLDAPAGASWETGVDYEADRSSVAQAVTFYANRRIGAEECLWVRVWQKHVLTLETVSNNGLKDVGLRITAPSISDISYNTSNNAVSWTVTNNSDLNCTFKSEVLDGSNKVIASATGTSPSMTLNLGAGAYKARTTATFGSYSSVTTTTFEPTLVCTSPAKYTPTNVRATAASTVGSASVTWTNTMKNVTEAEVTVATDPTEWDKTNPDFVDTVTVSGSNPTSATIGGLSYGIPYYFKVRTTNTAGTSGYSANTGSCTLSAGSVTPDLRLAETTSHDIVVSWGWATWTPTQRIELEWDDEPQSGDSNADTEGEATIERNGRGGTGTYTIKGLKRGKTWYVWARYGADAAWTNRAIAQIALTVTPINPTNISFVRAPQTTDEEGKSTVKLTWANNWVDTDTTEVSWSDNYNAWSTTSGPNTSTLPARQTSILIPNLDLGKTWYARVKLKFEEFETADMTPVSLDLRTKPVTPRVTLSSYDIYQYGKTDISWSYSNEDLSEQRSAAITVRNSSNTIVGTLAAGAEQAITLYAEEMGLAGNADYTVTVRTISANGIQSDESEKVGFHVNVKPEAEITSTSLDDGVLTALPLEVTVGGAEHNGSVRVYIERSKAVFLERPDETTQHGYEGELIAVKDGGSDGEVTFTMDDLRSPFEDNSEYRIVAMVIDQFGSSDPVTEEFTCLWDHQAIIPEASIETDVDEYITKITVAEPENVPEGDTFDIYRLSADKPELIIRGGTWDVTYVDPYPALGDHAGHRIVYRTAEGDYTTEDGNMAWVDLDGSTLDGTEPEAYFFGDKTLIDFDDQRIQFDYNITLSSSWEKDFTETKYLGGAVQGDWNPAVSRTGSVSTVMLAANDTEEINKMRRLAAWPGICHVRTPDGSSFAADVEVSEDRSHESAGKIVEFSVDITRVDSESLDGMTLAEWEGTEES